jgi:uncharacterized protein (TIGR02246 family)
MDSSQKISAGRTVDLEAIERVIATIEHSQRDELVHEFLALLREDAVWTTAHGNLLIGEPAITEFTRTVLPGAMAETAVGFEVAHISSAVRTV